MAFTPVTTAIAGTVYTAARRNVEVRDNFTAIYAGAMALTSQAAGSLIYASSATQLARLPIGAANTVLTSSGGAPQWSTSLSLAGTLTTAGHIYVSTAGESDLFLSAGAGGYAAAVAFRTGSALRWTLTKNTTAESGADAGSNLTINRYSDAGALLGTVLTLTRASGLATWANAVTVTGITTLSDDVKVAATKKVYLDAGTHSYLAETSSDVVSLYAGGVLTLTAGIASVKLGTSDACYAVVAQKTTTGDPAGVEGMIYVNSYDTVVRVYSNAAWHTIGASWAE